MIPQHILMYSTYKVQKFEFLLKDMEVSDAKTMMIFYLLPWSDERKYL